MNETPPVGEGNRAMNSRTLTLTTLKKKGACSEQVALFRKMFGRSVEITEALCVEHASVFSWGWAARNLLTAPALAEYLRATAPAWARAYISDERERGE